MNAQPQSELPPGYVKLRAGPLKQLHIDKHRLADRFPDVLVIRVGENFYHARTVWWNAESAFVFQPQQPLMPGGTYAWIETYGEVLYWP